MGRKVHEFDNGVKVYDDQLLDLQRERYLKNNVHEAEEECIFIDLLDKVNKNSVYVNIGAAIGYYSILAKKYRSSLTVIAYEPLKQHRSYFYENIALNGLDNSDFTIYSEGVYSSRGFESFEIENYSSMVKCDDKKGLLDKIIKYVHNERIKVITLEDVWSRISDKIDLVQMDIQGLELEVLKSSENFLRKQYVETFLIGTHSKSTHEKCRKAFLENGYLIALDKYETELQPDGILVARASSV